MHTSLAPLGWDDALARAFSVAAAPNARPARVSRVDRGAVDCLWAPAVDLRPVRLNVEPHHPPLAVGDWIGVDDDDAGPRLARLLPRRTAISRATASGRSEPQVLAANVDLVVITVPAFPEPKIGMVERMVALAWDSGATPVVVLTKADLTDDAEGLAADLAAAAPGVDVVAVSAVSTDGAEPLRAHLGPGRTLCLLGRSGAGKSTLANALLGDERFATGDIRADGKGRHTTTHRELVLVPGGGVLLDTPGLRGAGLWVTDEGLDRTFADVEELLDGCRFTDCGHDSEPGCALLAAVDDGRLAQRRLDSWRKLQREAQWMATRHDARLRAERRRAWKSVTMEMRRSARLRP